MKKKFPHPVLLLLLVVTTLVGCKKDEETNPSKLDIITQNSWIGSKVYENGADITQAFTNDSGFDITKNSVKLERNGSFTDSYEGIIDNGTWEFRDNESKLFFKYNSGLEQVVSITALNSKEFYYMYDNGLEFRYIR